TARFELVLLETELAPCQSGLDERCRLAELRLDRDHSSRGIAVKRRRRTAQYLDALRGTKVDAVDSRLSVGEGLGYAVDVHTHAADAEAGTRAEAAQRDAQVLGEVVAVLHVQAGNAGERLVQRKLLRRVLDSLLPDQRYGARYIAHRRSHAGGGDDDFIQCLAPAGFLAESRDGEERRCGETHEQNGEIPEAAVAGNINVHGNLFPAGDRGWVPTRLIPDCVDNYTSSYGIDFMISSCSASEKPLPSQFWCGRKASAAVRVGRAGADTSSRRKNAFVPVESHPTSRQPFRCPSVSSAFRDAPWKKPLGCFA